MKREEQIKEASRKEMMKYPNFHITAAAFRMGARWADAHPNWISVEDDFPKKHDSYLTCTSGNVIEITHYNIDGWHTESRGEVAYWMPLPAPAKEGGAR